MEEGPSFLEVGGAGRDFVVSVAADQLPDDISRVRALLDNEQAPIDVWIDVAKAYLANGKPQQCEALLKCVPHKIDCAACCFFLSALQARKDWLAYHKE